MNTTLVDTTATGDISDSDSDSSSASDVDFDGRLIERNRRLHGMSVLEMDLQESLRVERVLITALRSVSCPLYLRPLYMCYWLLIRTSSPYSCVEMKRCDAYICHCNFVQWSVRFCPQGNYMGQLHGVFQEVGSVSGCELGSRISVLLDVHVTVVW